MSDQNYSEGNEFDKFLPRVPSSTSMSAESQRVCVMFHAFCCSTKKEDAVILIFTCKLAPAGLGYEDGDSDDFRSCVEGLRKKRNFLEQFKSDALAREEKLSLLSDTLVGFIDTAKKKK